jgi:thiamine-phosphate pyrophosphorylase
MQIPRFYPILDVATAQRHEYTILTVASEILDAGAKILQLRHKEFFSREMFAAMEEIRELCRQADAILVINDRADIARILAENGTRVGVHLGQQDLTPTDVRKAPWRDRRMTGPEMLIGFSTHNKTQLRAAEPEPADYLAFGPIFGTSSKQNPDPAVGLDELRRLRPLVSRPLVAIGGITRANALSVLEAGADSVAVIGDLFPTEGRIRDRVEEWLALAPGP